MHHWILSVLLALPAGVVSAQHHGHAPDPSPPGSYAGQQSRDIKALSAQEQRGWLEGQGMGLARAAELNGYPGPMHVLELAQSLNLNSTQVSATQTLMDRHKAQVRALGAQLVAAEREMDRMFQERRATPAAIEQHTLEIASLHAQIRASHLRTHLEQTALLSTAQVGQYQILRGYR